MIVRIPSQLLSYTQVNRVDIDARTLGEVLLELDRRYPGLRFRIVDEQEIGRAHV